MWDYDTGLLTSRTDADNSLATPYTYDTVGRPATVVEASQRRTRADFSDQYRKVTVERDRETLNDGKLETVTEYDTLGRVTQVQTTDTASTWITVKYEYRYSADGSETVTSTPHRTTSDPTMEWICTQQDHLKRVIRVSMFTGISPPTNCASDVNRTGSTKTEYGAAVTAITDPAGKVRTLSRDALGRLVQVTEDPGTGTHLDEDTTYAYDPLDNLVKVTQGSQSRSFVYSSLSRLRSASNPESGTSSYTYDDVGNLLTRADARGIVTTFGYDDLQRILTKGYSDTTPDVTYLYYTSTTPNIGQLQSMKSSAATSSYVYDALGRVTSQSQTIAGHPDTFTFTNMYFLNDALKSQTYPSGKMVNYTVDTAGRVTEVSTDATTYADMTGGSKPAYTADGRLFQMKLGNNLWETRDYRPPNMITRFKLGTSSAGTSDSPGTSERLELGYDYHDTQNNGNLQSHTINRAGSSWTQNYGYDAVNRLETAVEVNGFNRTFEYDRYGNRWLASNTGMTYAESHEPQSNVFNAATNRMNTTPTIDYDAAGNQDKYSPWALVYDAENRLTSMTKMPGIPSIVVGEGTYAYDGEGRRVKKVWTPPGGAAEETYFVYDPVGNLAAEYGTGTAPASGTSYLFADMLGSVRAVTDAVGVVQECYDHLPFGRLLSASDNGRATLGCHPASPDASLDSRAPQKFTGQLRDEETRLDYFKARYYSAPEGRFLSPDRPFADQNVGDPQSWNLYAYTRNNPLAYTDPSGRTCTIIFANRGSAFCKRAALYAKLDTQLGPETRFFAAASAISQTLANTDSWFGNALVDPETRMNLLVLGGDLQTMNIGIAELVQHSSLSGSDLDAAIVHIEQTAVQRFLDGLSQSDPDRYAQLISDANNMLNPQGSSPLRDSLLFSPDKAMLGILDEVRSTLGSNIDFANQAHREALGNSLIEYIGRGDGCFVHGQLVPGC